MSRLRHPSSRGRLLFDPVPNSREQAPCGESSDAWCSSCPRQPVSTSSKVAALCSLVMIVLATHEYNVLMAAASVRSALPSSTSSTSSSAETWIESDRDASTGPGLLSASMIRNELLAEAPWAESHGSDHDLYLGAGMLYYGFAYAFQARTIVVLGSGGGFVPRILKQAQRDLSSAGRYSDVKGGGGGAAAAELYLVDAHLPSAGWGSTFYAENVDTVMRQRYQDIRYLFNTTDAAFEMLKERGVNSIDYLHIDADHSFEQSYKDFENYVQLLSPRGVVSFHDTCSDTKRQCRTGVPRTVAAISSELDRWGLQLLDAHYLYRGVAFAIRKSAPGLDAPPKGRRNFCKHNAQGLSKTSAGFGRDDERDGLPNLGDFYRCHTAFNMSELVGGCPYGTRRVTSTRCSLCIPGMIGEACRQFLYGDVGQQEDQSSPSAVPAQQQQHSHVLAAAWLSGRRSTNLMELGIDSGGSVVSLMQHPIVSSVVVDVRVKRPVWSDIGDRPVVRHLPCNPRDVLPGGQYFFQLSTELSEVDAVVCMDCDLRKLPRLDSLETALPHARTIVVEGPYDSEAMEDLLNETGPRKTGGLWHVEHDLLITDKREGHRSRRIILLVRSQ